MFRQYPRAQTAQQMNTVFAMTQGVFWAGNCMYYAFLVSYLESIHFSYGLIGLLTTCNALLGVVLQPMAGYLTDTFLSPKRFLAITISLSIPCTLLLPLLAGKTWGVFAAVLPLVMLETAMGGVIDSWFVKLRESNPGMSYSRTRAFGSIFYGVAAYFAGLAISRLGFTVMFSGHMVLQAMLLFLIAALPDSPCVNSPQSEGNAEKRLGLAGSVKLLLDIPPYVLFLFSALIFNIGMRSTATFIPSIVTLKGGDFADIGLVVAIGAFCEFPIVLLSSRIFRKLKMPLPYVAGAVIMLVRILLLIVADNVAVVGLSQLMQSITSGIYIAFIIEYVSKLVPHRITGTAITVAQAVTVGVGSVVGNSLGGILMERLGLPFFLLANILFVAAGLLIFLPSLLIKKRQA